MNLNPFYFANKVRNPLVVFAVVAVAAVVDVIIG